VATDYVIATEDSRLTTLLSFPINSIEFVTAGRQFGHVFILFVVISFT
jgi:hypothetical protein